MPLTIQDNGADNEVEIDDATKQASDGMIVFKGDGNRVSIEKGVTLQGASIMLGNRSSVTIGADCSVASLEVLAVLSGHITIGSQSNFTWHTRLYLHEPGMISIGSRCLIASGVLMTVSDMHSIIDRKTGLRINPAADIDVGDDVWLGYGVTLLGGAEIGSGSVVGLGSVVTGALADYTLSVGSPARTIKSDISWDEALR